MEKAFSSPLQGASPPRCKPEETGKSTQNRKPGSVGKSTLPGVEAAGFDTVRSMVARNPWSGFRSPFRANKLGAFPASPDSPPGWHFPRLPRPPRVLSPSFRIAITRDTHKGHPGLLCRSGGIRTRGLLVPKQRFCPFFRLFPVFFRKLSVFSAFCRLFPPVSGNFQAVLNWTFSFFSLL